MKVTIDEKNGTITIVAELKENPENSKSGKSLVIATTGGNVETTAKFQGRPVHIGLNAYTKN